MECQNCHKPLTDPRVCRHCGTAQSIGPEPVKNSPPAPAAADAPPLPPHQEKIVAPAQEPAEAEPPAIADRVIVDAEAKRIAAEKRIQIKLAKKAAAQKSAPEREQPTAPPAPPPPAAAPPPEKPKEIEEEKPIPAEAQPQPATPEVVPEPEPVAQPEPPSQRARRAAAPPASEPFEPAQIPAPERAEFKVRVSDSQLREFNAIHGNENILNKGVIVSVGGREEKEPSIFDCLTPLPDLGIADPGTTAFLAHELRAKAAALRRGRILLMTCANESFLRGAAVAVIETLGCPPSRRKMLNFMWPGARSFTPTIQHFLATRPEPRDETIVVVDALGDAARQFVDSLFAVDGAWSYDVIRDSLLKQKLSLICQLNSTRFGTVSSRELQRFPFEYWKLSYVQYLLRPHYPKDFVIMESTLDDQRKRGRWATSEADFHEQIRELAKAGQLERIIVDGGISRTAETTDGFPKSNQPIHLVVVYVVTFFPNLSPVDFHRLVTLLLGKRKRIEPVIVERKNNQGVAEQVEVQRETLLADVWLDDADSILAECQVVTGKDGQRVVTFAAAGCRDRYRAHMESAYGLYVQQQFQTILNGGLLLDSSDTVAEGVRLLTLDMIEAYPQQFNQAWLYELTASASRNSSSARTSGPAESDAVFRRVGQLLSDLWSAHQEPLVHGVLHDLIEGGLHEPALALLPNLRFKRDFGEFDYLRQLVERGSDETRQKIAASIGHELRLPGRLFNTFHALEAWLPEAAAEPERYSRASTLALRIFLEYCVEATTQYDLRHYGKWPTDFPLLDVSGRETAREELAMLARWLLHPGLSTVFEMSSPEERTTRFIAALVSEWAFILLGPASFRAETVPPPAFSAEDALAVLLEQIIDRGQTSQRSLMREMVEYWEELKEILLAVANFTSEDAVRREVLWKRQIVRKLLNRFRELRRLRKPTLAVQAASA